MKKLILIAALALAGCGEVAGPIIPEQEETNVEGVAQTAAQKEEQAPILQFVDMGNYGNYIMRDRETGCHFIRGDGGGIIPRPGRYINGKQQQEGCYIEEHGRVGTGDATKP